MTTLQEKATALFEDQKISWPMLGTNWNLLKEVRVRELRFGDFLIRLQFNPKRIVSSAARVDRDAIEKRACFLCPQHRPPEEKSVWFGRKYEIMCNPFPIFQKHFTIARREHTPQVIRPEFEAFLGLSRELPDLVVFYNAPACGASAPDHMHFQAGNRGLMPIESDLEQLSRNCGILLVDDERMKITAIRDGLRNFFLLESDSEKELGHAFGLIFDFMARYQGQEPLLNLLLYFDRKWQLLLFPREKHRPWQYFEEGKRNILLSPAAVDMGGTLIIPLEKDFRAITEGDIRDIYGQVTCSPEHFDQISRLIQTKLKGDGK
ncbi:MAG: DUF4922 domain-containing protein [Bacteroidales bacterium]